jgi:predicted alpha-1,2-mannosidase
MTRFSTNWQRRDFLKASAAAAARSFLAGGGVLRGTSSLAQLAARSSPSGDAGPVRPMIGTGWHGHTFPGAVAPFGMVQLSPDTSGAPEALWNNKSDSTGWDHCSGYHYADNVIAGFTHTHLQGTGGIDLGDVLLMPMVEGRNWSWNSGTPGSQAQAQIQALGSDAEWVLDDSQTGYFSWFTHDREVARPGYYTVHLATPDVHAELAATTRCGIHRYTWPAGDARRGVMLDLIHGLGSTLYEAELNYETPSRVSGHRFTNGWAADKQLYFVIEWSQPAVALDVKSGGKVTAAVPGLRIAAKELQAIVTLGAGPEPLLLRIGISATSVEGARKNLAEELPHWNFDAVARQTQQAWSDALAVFAAEFAQPDQGEVFASGAYHSLVAPATFNDVDGAYRGQDRRNHPNPGFTKYTTISIWDIYRGQFPLLMLMQPHRTGDIVRTLLADYDQLGQNSLPVWPLWGNETWCMTGFHVVGMIASAWARGLRDFDGAAAYAAMRDTALTGAVANDNKSLQEQFRRYGYVPTGDQKQSVSRTLDFAYDYWCTGAMADMLGHHDDARIFYQLGQNYRNLFDPVTGFMRGKSEDGRWREPFRPDREYWQDYTESDGWQATFNVMQDVDGLIALYGGDAPFVAKLDALFAAPSDVLDSPPDITGMIGQDAQGNEPSNHIPYLYAFAGAPWKTQLWVRRILRLYNNTPAGIPGNDDCGQLSSWAVFAALGFYPVNAVTGVYVLGSPSVQRARIRNPATGAVYTIVAENNAPANVFIRDVSLNGKPLSRCWLTHAEIAAGGDLHFRMAATPNKDWAAAKEDRPPSGLLPAH